MIERSGERWSRISVQAARHDDDDDDDDFIVLLSWISIRITVLITRAEAWSKHYGD